jgi:hypothetical protein
MRCVPLGFVRKTVPKALAGNLEATPATRYTNVSVFLGQTMVLTILTVLPAHS